MSFDLFRKILEFYKTAKISVEELKPLEKFTTSEENPKFFFTMTEINKIGINPQSKYDTPIGIYSYPLTKEYYTKLITNTLPFAGDKQYINLFSISDKTNKLSNYNNLKSDLIILKKYYNDNEHNNKLSDDLLHNAFNKIKTRAFRTAFQKSDVSKFWNLTRLLSKTPLKWNALFRQLGYFDDSIFNSLKPYQMMYILNNNIIEKELVFEKLKNNKYLQEDLNLLTFFLKNTLKPDKNLIDDIIDYAAQNTLEEVYNVSIIGDGLLVSDDKLIWYKNGKYHREDGPAVKYADGSKEWWLNDNLHRDGGPAVEKANGDKYWYKNGKRHREDGPAVEFHDGTKMWYTNGKLHREDGPAIEYADGTKKWFKNGKQHREDGPAIEYADGSIYWVLNNEEYGHNDEFTNESWKEFVKTL